jgi:ATP/maltotriose-dependent transcriptional regulator MalT
LFLHVLTAVDASVDSVPTAAAQVTAKGVLVTLGSVKLAFTTDEVGGFIEREGKRSALGGRLPAPQPPSP